MPEQGVGCSEEDTLVAIESNVNCASFCKALSHLVINRL
jgi:hypothetical protein